MAINGLGKLQHLECDPLTVESLNMATGKWGATTYNGYAVRIVNWNQAISLQKVGALLVKLNERDWLWYQPEAGQ